MVIKKFEKTVSRYKDKIAVKAFNKSLTYDKVNKYANRVARKLIMLEEKVNINSVALLFDHGIDMIIAIFAVLKACKAYVPLDISYPHKRLEYMLEHSEANVIITNNKDMKTAQELANEVSQKNIILNIEEVEEEISSRNLDLEIPKDHIAYLLYTSGSTGKPKAVMQTHRNILFFIDRYTENLGITSDDNMTLFSSFSHDAAVMDIYGALLNGATLFPQDIRRYINMPSLSRWIRQQKISIWHSVPTLYRHFARTLEENEDFSELRYIVLGGEAVRKNDIDIFNKLFQKTTLYNLYGQSESSYNCGQYIYPQMEVNKITLGSVVEGTELIVVNEKGEEVEEFETGEILVVSDHIALGYWKDDENTSKAFLSHSQLGKIYRTGDMGRIDYDGSIKYIGRKDNQVKVRGYRIELGDIESSLLKHDAIKEAVVIAKEDIDGDTYLCAYIVSDEDVIISDLRKHLSMQLPDYMVPSYFTQIERIPLTPNGKIARKELANINENISLQTKYEGPRNEVEERLIAIWQEVLGVKENIGINDNFFELGGHSLKATSLVSRIHRELGVEIPLQEIFSTPSIKEISKYMGSAKASIYSLIEPTNIRETYPLSSAQKRLFMLQKLEENNMSYNIQSVMTIEGSLDIKRLEMTFRRLIKRHEALRTCFKIIDGEPNQKVYEQVDFNVEYINGNEKQVEEIIRTFMRSFDFSKAPLFRVCLVKISENKHILIIDIHHIISDGASIGILTREFTDLYEGKELSSLRIQYKDYAVWQNSIKEKKEIKKQEEYWIDRFKDEVSILNMPIDYPRPKVQSFKGARINFKVKKEVTNSLKRIAKENNATLYMILLTAFSVLLHKYTGQEDIIVGSPVAGRRHVDLEKVVGMFVNTLAMRNYPKGNKTFKEFLCEVRDNAIEAYKNQDYQFEELVKKLDLRRDTSRNPLFDVMLTLQNMGTTSVKFGDLETTEYKYDNMTSKFDIGLTAYEVNESIYFTLEYCTELFREATIKRFKNHFMKVLKEVVNNDEIKLSEINMMTDEEERKIIYDFNNTKSKYPKNKTIHQLFEEQVEKNPDNIAVVYEDEKMTYRELNEKSNQLARKLNEKGVKANSIVGIIVERSLEMIIGIMGILKARGAYLPIDPKYPIERIDYILKDSETKIVLTNKKASDKDIESNNEKNRKYGIVERLNFNGEFIDLGDKSLYTGDRENLKYISNSKDLAYIIYTSGSTGKPKGVMIEHYSLVNRIDWMQKQYPIHEEDVILQKTSYTFDVSVWELFWWSITGTKVCLLKNGGENDPQEIINTIEKQKVTTMHFVPSILNIFIEYIESHGTIDKLKSLRQVFSSGEALRLKTVERFNSILYNANGTKLTNLYGPTEATIDVSYFDCWKKELKLIPIGKPIDNINLYIINNNNKLQSIGIAGELCISGDGLARGYLNRPELTKEKFVDSPFKLGEKMYKTGDLARWMADGNIEFLGRIDNQVKIRGFRIELGEIEKQLLKHSDVKEVIVLAREDKKRRYLCGYIVSDKELTILELREHLSKKLPEYMIPSYFIQIDEMPLTLNGKIDRKTLPQPDVKMDIGTEYEAPRDEVEEILVSIWQEVLEFQKKIGIHDNFFSIGGDSILSIQVVSRANEKGLIFTVQDVFKYPTISNLAKHLNTTKDEVEPNKDIQPFSLLSDEDKEKLIKLSN